MSLRQFLILATIWLTSLLYGMTITVANVVLPQIKGALSATQDQIAWVVTFNLIATAVTTPMTGWLAARFGWRNLMVGCVAGFTVSSLMCALADSLAALVLYRIGQGLFAGPMLPLGQAVLLASFPKRQHALVIMLWGIGGVLGPVLGPILGGYIAEVQNWRWAFFMIVPFGFGGLVLAWFALDDTERERGARLDWTGFLALSVAIGAAQLVLDRGQRLDWFTSPEIVIETVLGLIGLYIFVVHSLTAAQPFLSPRMLLDRNFVLGIILVFIMGMMSYTPMVLFPALLQDLRGFPDSVVGTLLTARGIGNWLSFLVVVQCTRYNARLTLATGFVCQALAGWYMAQLDINLTGFDVFWTNVLQGFGFGLAFTPMTVLTFATLEQRLVTQGTAVFHMLRNFGSSLFISISIVVLVGGTAMNYATLSESASPYNKAFSFPGLAGGWSIEGQAGLQALSSEVERQAAMIGYINAFYLMALVVAIAVPLVPLFRTPVARSAVAD